MITLSRESLQIFEQGSAAQHSWPLKVTATAEVGATISAKIFVFHAGSVAAASPQDRFECVASVHQMADLPETNPIYDPSDPSKCVPFYRLNSLTFHCLSPQEADELWLHIQEDVTDLIANHVALSGLRVTESVSI